VTALALIPAFALGAVLWTLGEYLLHRFAMHELRGKGIMSREHLEHHVKASWHWSYIFPLAWTGQILVGFAAWMPLFGWLFGWSVGLAVALGWSLGYFFYEWEHRASHLKPPRNRYQRWLRVHHFHHHFGHPMSNHGVTVPWWDKVFGTFERPERVRVPRRLAMTWLVDEHGEVRPEHAADYELVGAADSAERLAQLDRARAFASIAPED
jgi:sterol desaturase/sphingolipid hydroxylase (fatty acid hydroxylase superfamily)